MNATIKNLLLWMVILVLIILAWNVFKTGATGQRARGNFTRRTVRALPRRCTVDPSR